MLFYFVRHGDPCYNPDSLTPLGLRQAEAVGKRIARYGIDQIFASPMKRAIQTAQPASEMLRRDIRIAEFSSEDKAWGELTALNDQGQKLWACAVPRIQKLFASQEVRALGMQWYTHPAFQGTLFQQGMERIARESDAFFAALGYERMEREGFYRAVRPNHDRIALFAHGGFGGAFLSHVLGIPYPQFSQMLNISHTSLTVIEFSPHPGECIPVILTASNDAHLYHEHLPLYDRAPF